MKKVPSWLMFTVVLLIAASLIWLFSAAAGLRTPKPAPDDPLLDQMEQQAIDFKKWKVRTFGINGKRNSLGR